MHSDASQYVFEVLLCLPKCMRCLGLTPSPPVLSECHSVCSRLPSWHMTALFSPVRSPAQHSQRVASSAPAACRQFPAHPKPAFRCAGQKLTSRKGDTFSFWLLICFYFPPSASLRHDQFIYSCVSFYLGFFVKVMFSFIFNSFLSSVISFLIFLILICAVLSW